MDICTRLILKGIFMKAIYPYLFFLLFFSCFFSTITLGKDTESEKDPKRDNALRVFLDCRTCDMNYTREQIPYVNYVRDVKEAEVFILVSSQSAGSGGTQYTYTFKGQEKYLGMNDTLTYTSSPDETSMIIRERRTNLLKMGLMRYVAKTPLAPEITIGHNPELKADKVIDKWDSWIFEISVSPRFDSEESYSRVNLSNSVNISRITPELKLEINIEQSTNKQRYNYGGEAITYTRNSESIDNLLVKSFGEHWSAGFRLDLMSATNPNYDIRLQFMPAVEYNLYPYEEATHRQLRFLYSAGYQYNDYIDTTIFNKTRESLFQHDLSIAYQIQEAWGSINISLSASNYFHDWSKNRIELDGFLRLRIIKGLSLSLNGEIGYINNQLNLRKGSLTEAERLLRLKQQATNYSFGGSIGLTYTFGSIYNNVVNPRFGNRGRGGMPSRMSW